MIQKIVNVLRREGIIDFLLIAARKALYVPVRRIYNKAIDRYNRIDTEEEASLISLGISDDIGEMYQPTPIDVFRSIMSHFDISPSDVFLDMGSGKGRTMLLAGKYPFNKIIGVDVSRELNRIAECNVRRMKPKLACQEYEFVTSNAFDYEIPPTATYVYLFNPFRYDVLHQILLNIENSIKQNPRNVILFYYNPKFSSEMESEHKLIKIFDLVFDHWSLRGAGRLYRFKCYIYRFPIS
jgi:hypothetical protein